MYFVSSYSVRTFCCGYRDIYLYDGKVDMTSHWDEFEKSQFMNTSQGQITQHTRAGIEIMDLLQKEAGATIQTIVEIGTWNGCGSTLCILKGLYGRKIDSFHSLECNREKHLAALENLDGYMNEATHILWGTIVDPRHITSEEYKKHFPKLLTCETYRGWFNVDIKNCEECPNVLEQLPAKIDLLFLDGGEYTTLNEFEILLPRCSNYILLDDTKEDKCRECRELLRANSSWTEVLYLDERNGFSIFKKTL